MGQNSSYIHRQFGKWMLLVSLSLVFMLTVIACETASKSVEYTEDVFKDATGAIRGESESGNKLGDIPKIEIPKVQPTELSERLAARPVQRPGDVKWPEWNKSRDVTGRPGFEGVILNLPDEKGPETYVVGQVSKVQIGYQSGAELPFDKGPKAKIPPRVKISSLLQERINSAKKGDRALVVINLKDDFKLERLPRLGDVKRGTTEYEYALKSRLTVIDDLKERRTLQASEFLGSLGRRVSVELVETGWLTNAPLVSMELLDVPAVAQLDSVLFVSLNEGEDYVSQGVDLDVDNDILDVRQQLRTNPYDKSGLRGGYIGVIDSGTRLTHDMLDDDPWDFTGDCAEGGGTCWGDGSAPNGAAGALFPNYDVADYSPHGTPIIGGIAGSDDLGAELRGITQITTDMWKHTNRFGTITSNGVTRAIQKAVTSFDDVINISFGGWPTNADGLSSRATQLDDAYDLGLMVIVANGNAACHAGADGSDGFGAAACADAVTRSPAIQFDENGIQLSEPGFTTVLHRASAHKIISVGAHEVDPLCNSGGITSNVCSYSSRGPTADGRYKPDILGYTNYESTNITADNTTRNMGGTSGAAPTIAAMAQMYNNWMEKGTKYASWLTPGHVYAALLGSGEHTTKWEGSYDYIGVEAAIAQLNIEGVGRPKMAVNGTGYIGTVTMKKTGDLATINLNVPKGACGIKAAIWWPEDAGQQHNDIDLLIKNPKGQVISAAMSGNSVWERGSVSAGEGGLSGGTYKAQVLGFDVNSDQPVYYFVSVSKSQCWG